METVKRFLGLLLLLAIFAPGAEAQPGLPGGGTSNALQVLDYWQFSDTNWLSADGDSPIAVTNIVLSTNGDGGASLLVDSTNTAYLIYPVTQGGHTNLMANGADGSFSFWFMPSWSSADQPGGTGPGGWARLLEVGSFTTNASNGWFSLYLSPDGENLLCSTEDTNGVYTNVLYAPVSWAANTWHFLALTYSSTNSCALYADGVLLTNGPPLSLLPGLAALTNGFAIAGSLSGAPDEQAHGTLDDLYTYQVALGSNYISATYDIFGLVIYGVTNFTSSAPYYSTLPTPTNGFNAVTGPGFLQWVGTATNVSLGGQVYIANPVAFVASNLTTTFQFAIGGGTNGLPYDVFATAALAGGGLSNSVWYWLGQGYTGNTYQLTNEPGVEAYYVLGTPQDSDFAGLTDAYMLLVLHADPFDPDIAYDGLSVGWNLYYGVNPFNPVNVPQLRLGYWRFNTNSWVGEEGQQPVVAANLALAPSWSGSAVQVDTNVAANLRYLAFDTTGFENINCANGSVRFWVNSDWAYGTGPGTVGRILELGDASSAAGYWALNFTADGRYIYFESSTNNSTNTYLNTDFFEPSNTWHQIVITYTSGSNGATALYEDGSLAATGSGIASWPSAAARAAYGFNLGSSHDGTLQSRARFDELETFNYPLSAADIAANYNALAGLNPVPQVSFSNNFVTNTTVTASITGAAAAMAVLVNSTNFASATWSLFATNATVNLGSGGDGARMVYFGFADMNGDTAWTGQRITVDTVPPVITVTNPIPGTTNSWPMIQLQGYSAEPLSSLTYDLTNAAGLLTNQPGFVTDEYYDTNVADFTTNWFQCYDLVLTNGVNTVTLHATDRAGNTTVTNFTFTLVPGTNAPVITLDFPTNGESIGSGTFTIVGSLDNPTATISATITDSSGNTNILSGLVERSGGYWVENMPLSAGTSTLTLSATDAWGNTTTTNVSVTQSAIVISSISVDSSTLFQPTTTVFVYDNDPSGTVTVNGTAAYLYGYGSGAAWEADNVPVADTGKGTARFTASAQDGTNTAGLVTDVDKPPHVYVAEYVSSLASTSSFQENSYTDSTEGTLFETEDLWGTNTAALTWLNGVPAGGSNWTSSLYEVTSTNTTTSYGWTLTDLSWPAAWWPTLESGTDTNYSNTGNSGGYAAAPPIGPWESCAVTAYTANTGQPGYWDPLHGWLVLGSGQQYQRTAQTVVKYYTGGGQASPGAMDMHEFYTTAWQITNAYATPPYFDPNTGLPTTTLTLIPGNNIVLGGLGRTTTNGGLDRLLPRNSTYTLTASIGGVPQSISQTTATRYTMMSQCAATYPTNRARTDLGVREFFTVYCQPAAPNNTQWYSGYPARIHFGSSQPYQAPDRATNMTITMTLPEGGSQTMTFNVFEPSGVDHAVIIGTSNVASGAPTFANGDAGAEMKLQVFIAPTNVSLAQVYIREIQTDATNITGYFADPLMYTNPAVQLRHTTDTLGVQLDAANSWTDTCWSTVLPTNSSGAWTNGSYTWNISPIPWAFYPTALLHGFTNNPTMPGWQQVFTIDPGGTVTITKFSSNRVTRTTNNFITIDDHYHP